MQAENQEIMLSIQEIYNPYVFAGGIILVIFLLFLSALFSGAEAAFFSLNTDDKARLEALRKRKSSLVLSLLSEPELLLTTVMNTSLFLNLLVILISSLMLSQIELFYPGNISGILLQIAVITPSILILVKLLPRLIAHNRAFGFAMVAAVPIKTAKYILNPLNYVLIRAGKLVSKKLTKTTGNISLNDLSEALDQNKTVITEDRNILEGIVNFSTIEVSEVMRPRMDVIALEFEMGFTDLLKEINESGYSRIPVFADTFDNIKGILYVKDLLPFLGENDSFHWQELIRPAYFVPETKKLNDLLQEFLEKKNHMAIVVDEYGGTEGIVTLEDILEEIVGEITDETDEIESFYSRIDEFTYIFDGKVLMNDFFKILDLPEELFDNVRGEADTLAGLILEVRGEIPGLNESFLISGVSFTILAVDNRRIKKIRVVLDKGLKKK